MFATGKKRAWLPLTACSAILMGVLAWVFLRRLEATYQEAGETVNVLVARRYLARGLPLRPALFQALRVPRAYALPGAVTDFDVLESTPGHPRFRNALAMPEGTPLAQRDLQPLLQNETLSQAIPDNAVAVSFGVDAVRGLAGNIEPGDLVDVLHTPKLKEMDPAPRNTLALFEAVPVIAVGKKWAKSGGDSPKGAEEIPHNEGEETAVLTILLNPLAAVRLAQARENEVLSVMLRAPGDDRKHKDLP